MFRRVSTALAALLLFALLGACSSDSDLVRVDRFSDKRPDKREVGWLKDGKRHGQWQYYVDGRLFEIEHWRDGLRHGLLVQFYDDASTSIDYWWYLGEKHGRFRLFDKGGHLGILGWYRYYKEEGIWCEWYPDEDRLEKITEYRRGRAVRVVKDPSGECPLTVGHGRRHLDPNNRDYTWRSKNGTVRRRVPLFD